MNRPILLSVLLAVVAAGCATSTQNINPFMVFAETFGVGGTDSQGQSGGGGSGATSQVAFRREVTVTFRNNHPSAELNTLFVAWVDISRVRTAEQQDALLAGGYVQLAREVQLGSAFRLPVGTFVYNGGGTAGATSVVLGRAAATQEGDTEGDAQTGPTSTTLDVTLITPDVILVFSQPPVSCESVAFYYTDGGDPLTATPVGGSEAPFSGSTGTGPFKSLAQVNVYTCDPFRPGLFLQLTGGSAATNEYFEGDAITFDFNPIANANGDFCLVTIGGTE